MKADSPKRRYPNSHHAKSLSCQDAKHMPGTHSEIVAGDQAPTHATLVELATWQQPSANRVNMLHHTVSIISLMFCLFSVSEIYSYVAQMMRQVNKQPMGCDAQLMRSGLFGGNVGAVSQGNVRRGKHVKGNVWRTVWEYWVILWGGMSVGPVGDVWGLVNTDSFFLAVLLARPAELTNEIGDCTYNIRPFNILFVLYDFVFKCVYSVQ